MTMRQTLITRISKEHPRWPVEQQGESKGWDFGQMRAKQGGSSGMYVRNSVWLGENRWGVEEGNRVWEIDGVVRGEASPKTQICMALEKTELS